uniref:Uncharacterized protein n=1 Tax=Plectus sambesii TaxID=2011161 RepID=A0A914V4G6_9BILA
MAYRSTAAADDDDSRNGSTNGVVKKRRGDPDNFEPILRDRPLNRILYEQYDRRPEATGPKLPLGKADELPTVAARRRRVFDRAGHSNVLANSSRNSGSFMALDPAPCRRICRLLWLSESTLCWSVIAPVVIWRRRRSRPIPLALDDEANEERALGGVDAAAATRPSHAFCHSYLCAQRSFAALLVNRCPVANTAIRFPSRPRPLLPPPTAALDVRRSVVSVFAPEQ